MKKFLTLLAIGIVGFTSCKEELVQVYSISIDPTELSFNSGGGEETVTVTSTADWELSGDSYWCYASEYSGKGDAEIIFTADPNDDSESSRSATFTFISGDKKATLTVTQEKKEYSISIEPKELKFGAEGGEQEITVTSSDAWEVKGDYGWCDLSLTSGKDGDKVTFSADPYTNTEESRTATYTFICGDKEAELKIEQEAKVYSISVEPTELSFVSAGEEKEVTVTSSDEWEFSSEEYWISASQQNGENGATVKIIVDENPYTEIRTGTATFICGDKQAEVKVTQAAKEYSISVEPTELTFEAEGGEQTISITSSDRWELTTDSNWITTSERYGENGNTVTVIVGYTTSVEIRTGTITFTCGDKTSEVKIIQNPDDSPIIQFKDPYFLNDLLLSESNVDLNGDNQISEKEAQSVTDLKLYGGRARNMDELAYFTNLKSINILYYEEIESINLTNHTRLESIICYCGKNLDFSGCIVLNSVDINDRRTGIKTLNLSGCTSLINFYCRGNSLTSLDVSGCTALTSLDCSANFLTSLDVSGCSALTSLECHQNQFTSLDVSGCSALTSLECSENQLTSLDVSNNTALTMLSCSRNQLTSLDVSNNTALERLYCDNNQLTTLDVSNNTALGGLSCGVNQLTTLDVSNNTALTRLSCGYNQLTTLDVSNNTALTNLSCDNNQLTTLDVSNNTALTNLSCGGTQLTTLDVSNNTALTDLYCNNNPLTSLDVSKNRLLLRFECNNNPLQKIILYKYHVIYESYMEEIEEEYGDIIEYVE